MADTTEIRTRDLRARTPTRLPLRFLTPPTGVQADQAEKKTSPRNDGPTEIRTRDPRVRSPTLYRYATPPTPPFKGSLVQGGPIILHPSHFIAMNWEG